LSNPNTSEELWSLEELWSFVKHFGGAMEPQVVDPALAHIEKWISHKSESTLSFVALQETHKTYVSNHTIRYSKKVSARGETKFCIFMAIPNSFNI